MALRHTDCDCCEQARKRIAEITHAKDQENARLQSENARYAAAFHQARERTAHLRADWAAEPWKNEPGSFFNMNSIEAREALASLVFDLAEAREALKQKSA